MQPKPVISLEKGITDGITKAKHLRTCIPKGIPTDIVNCIGQFVHGEIRQGAQRLYDVLIHDLLDPKLRGKSSLIVEYLTEMFVDIYGPDFKSFLSKHDRTIKHCGFDVIYEFREPFLLYLCPKEDRWSSAVYGVASEPMNHFVYYTLEKMGRQEGFFKDAVDIEVGVGFARGNNMNSYLDSLIVRRIRPFEFVFLILFLILLFLLIISILGILYCLISPLL